MDKNQRFQLIQQIKEQHHSFELYGELFKAVKANNIPKATKLIKDGARVSTSDPMEARQFDDDENSLLHLSAKLGYLEMTALLISAGVPINCVNRKEHTPFHWATHNEELEVMDLLLKNGADINAKDFEGDTPLHWVALRKIHKSGEFLGKHGARFDLFNANGILPVR